MLLIRQNNTEWILFVLSSELAQHQCSSCSQQRWNCEQFLMYLVSVHTCLHSFQSWIWSSLQLEDIRNVCTTAVCISTFQSASIVSWHLMHTISSWYMMQDITGLCKFSGCMMQIMQAWMEDPKQMELSLPPIPAGLSDAARMNLEGLSAIVRESTQLNAADRPSFRQICQRIRELPMRNSAAENSGTPARTYATDLTTVV